jgi:hypothetical protein
VRTLAFVLGLCIGAVGAAGLLVPSGLVWLAEAFVAAGALGFYVIAVVRIAFGLILVSAAPASRAPRALRALGYVIVILGLATFLTGILAMGRGQGAIEWWLDQGSGVARVTAIPILALGGFVAFACAPSRSAA